MYMVKLAFKRLYARPGHSLLSLLLFAIGISIVSLIVLADKQFKNSIEKNLAGIDLVMGAKGSPMQLILSSVLHADYPTGNIKLAEAENIARNPLIKQYIPLALGDNYRGSRIVGTTLDYPQLYNAQLVEGAWFEEILEATIGHNVARQHKLRMGETFYGVHGFQDAGHAHPEFLYTVSGIMAPTGNVLDNLILTPVESVWKVHQGHQHDHNTDASDDCGHDDHIHDENCNHADHDHLQHDHDHQGTEQDDPLELIRSRVEAGEDISREEMDYFLAQSQEKVETAAAAPTDDREITAMLLVYRSPAANIQLPRMINESTNMQAASPVLELNRLFSLLAFGFDALQLIAWIIIVISGLNIFVLLWNTLRRGMSEIALMRVMGASRGKVFMLLLLQGMIIATAGWVIGIVMARAIWLVLPSLQFMPNVAFASLHAREYLLLVYALATGFLASFIPAWKAYHTDVHFTLTQPENA